MGLAFLFALCFPIRVAAATTLVVTVDDQNGQPVSGAHVTLAAKPAQTGTTDARGNVRLRLPETGSYTLQIRASGFHMVTETLHFTNQKGVKVRLEPSAGALQVIGSVTGHARTPFNATPVAQKVYPREAYRDQGQPDVSSVMNQTPGVLALTNWYTNTASPLAPSFASVRGALPYETPVLIDGEPILTPLGSLDLSLLPTYVLQEVEVVKGPGDIAGAGGGAGGAINFRTADPTLGQRGTYEIEGDSHGGSFSDLAYDGTEPGGALAYASMFSIDGESDYVRKAVLLKLRETPSTNVSITGTVMSVSLDRSEQAAYVFLGDSYSYEHLGFADLGASLDRGDDAYSIHLFTAQTQQGLNTPNLGYSPIADESGATLAWQHASGKLALATSARALYEDVPSTGINQTQSTARESLTYRPDSRSEVDLSGELTGDRTTFKSFSAPAARAGYSYKLASQLALRASYGTSAVLPPLYTIFNSLERATGVDAGAEWRLHGNTTTLSADLYRNATQGVYGFAFPCGCQPPMTESGAEFALQQFKRVGMGFIATLQLPRTYTALDPRNLGYTSIAPFHIPYAQGYTEISYKWPRGSRASIGALYVGSNNAYGAPAFATLNANLEISVGPRAKLQFSAQNLTNELANRAPIFLPFSPQYGLVPFTLRFMFRQSFGTGSLYEH